MDGSAGRVKVLPPIHWGVEREGILAYIANVERVGSRRAPRHALHLTSGKGTGDEGARSDLLLTREVKAGLGHNIIDAKLDPADNIFYCWPLIFSTNSSPCNYAIACPTCLAISTCTRSPISGYSRPICLYN